MKSVKELHDEKSKVAEEIRTLGAKADTQEWNAECEERWDAVNAEYDALDRQQRVAERLEKIQAFDAEVINEDGVTRAELVDASYSRALARRDENIVTPEDRSLAFAAWARTRANKLPTREQEAAAKKCGINLNAHDFGQSLVTGDYRSVRRRLNAEYRADPVNSTGAALGGTTIPEGFVYNLEKALLAYGSVRQVADVIRTSGVGDLPWPTANDTSNKGAQIDEVQDLDGATPNAFQSIPFSSTIWKAWAFTSKIIPVSFTLLDDTAFNFEAEAGAMAGERIARITEERFTTGNGTTTAQGIVTGASVGHTAASTTLIDSNDLLDLEHSVDPSYRRGGTVGFMMHDSILKVLRKLKDSDGRALWQNSLTEGEPQRLSGFPIYINQEMASAPVAGAAVMVFGDLSKYKIRDVSNFRLLVSEHRYLEFDTLAIVAHSRHDGRILNAGTNPIKKMVMAAS